MRALLLLATSATWALMVVGGTVSATSSGLGCGPEWPRCHGAWIPPFTEPAVFLEWFHRLIATLTGLLVVSASAVAWRRARAARGMRPLAVLALALLLVQVLLGALTVRWELPPSVDTAHLAAGTALFAVLVAMTATALGLRKGGAPASSGTVGWLWVAAGVTYLQMVLGAVVRHAGAGLACPDLPLCLGRVIPPLHGLVLLHFLHRLGGVAVLGLVLVAGGRVLRAAQASRLRPAAWAAIGLALVQVTLGILSVTTRLAPPATTGHLGVALLLLATLVVLGTWATLARSGASARTPTGSPVRSGEVAP